MTSLARHHSPLRWSLATLLLAAALLLPSLSGGAPTPQGLPANFDPAEDTTPLDLFGVRFGQTAGADLTLIIRTHKPWPSSLINPQYRRTLCILLRSDEQANPSGRLCAYPSKRADSGLGLRYTFLDQKGGQLGVLNLSPVVSRPNPTTLRVSFPPALLRLTGSLYHWQARSQYLDETTCLRPAGCEDLLPNEGEVELKIDQSIHRPPPERCFGAASRDVRRPCSNPELARKVVPTPDVAEISPNLPCTPLRQVGLVAPCEFGVPAADAGNTIALIGDSHAAHWRSALDFASQRLGWRGLSITRAGCPLTKATTRIQPATRRAQCVRWNQQVPRWLASNPKVSTVFVVAHFDAKIVLKGGKDHFAAKIAGYARVFRSLPKSVKRVVVIRDTPTGRPGTLNCVRKAMSTRRRPGLACAIPRKQALYRDAAASAANQLRTPKVKTIDMTSFFCSSVRCFPVIGGVLVYKDVSHLTDVFGSSLGPYLLRKIRALDGR